MKKKSIIDIPQLKHRTVFVTVDFNISLHNGQIANDTRIIEVLPTLKYLIENDCKIILASHLGRPKGYDKKFSLKPVAERLAFLTKKKVNLIDKYWEKDVLNRIKNIPWNQIILFENIRFCPEEEANDQEFSRHLASTADYFINDAFGASHRVHASIVGIAEFIPSYAGLLLSKEIDMLSKALEKPKRPFVVLIGGAKTPEKISVIERLLDICDSIVLGGAIANTFLAAWGFGMGQSMIDYEMIEMARVVFWKTTRKHSALYLPLDVVISDKDRKNKPKIVEYNKVPDNVAIYDIGPKSQVHYQELIKNARTIIWNGPMGFYEDPMFKKGTDSILKSISESKAFSIVGGGDTITSIRQKNYAKKISHISTGGSAMLEYLKKGSLPGIDVLLNKS